MTDPEIADQTDVDQAAELRRRWQRRVAPVVETIPAEAIDGAVRDAVAREVDAWIRSVLAARCADPEPEAD